MTVNIRTATEADATGIASVHVASWRAAYRGLVYDVVLDGLNEHNLAREWRREIVAPENPRSRLFVAIDGAGVAGYLRCGPSEDEDEDAAAEDGEVYGLYVHPDSWGAGAGRALFDAAVEHLRGEGFTRATLWVAEGSERARDFYERLGWQPANDGESVDFFGATEIRYVLSLP